MKEASTRIDVLQSLGKNPRGELLRVRIKQSPTPCAMRKFPATIWPRKKQRARFIDDCRVLMKVDSPNIAKVYDVGERGGEVFVVREMVNAIPFDLLFFHLVNLREGVLLRVALKILSALQEAHQLGITHGNLRLSNLFLEPDGNVKVADFALPSPSQIGEDVAGPLTEITAYMSPEALLGASVDERTDLFSLGVVLYNLAVLDRPFWGKTSREVRNKILSDLPKPFEDDSGVDPRLRLAILRCLQKNVEDRYQAVSSLRRELETLTGIEPRRISPTDFQAYAIRCGLEAVFRHVSPSTLPLVEMDETLSLALPEEKPEEVRPVEPEVEEPLPPPKVVPPPEAVLPPEATPPPAPAPVVPPKVEVPPPEPEPHPPEPKEPIRGPETVIRRFIRAWNAKSFPAEYDCFSKGFMKMGCSDYVERRMALYNRLARQGQVTQTLAKLLRVETDKDRAKVLCARRMEYPRESELFLEQYTLVIESNHWKIVSVKSKRTTEHEITRVVDHELTFLDDEPDR